MASFNINNPPANLTDKVYWCVQGLQIVFRRTASSSGGGGGGTPTSLPIGIPVTGGGANCVLYEDSSQNLATDSTFTFTGTGLHLDTKALFFASDAAKVSADSTTLTLQSNGEISMILDGSANTTTLGSGYKGIVTIPSLGATSTTAGLVLQNPTAATTGHGAVEQCSPALYFIGSATTAVALNKAFRMYYIPGGDRLNIDYSSDGSSFTNILQISSSGGITGIGGGNFISSGPVAAGTTVTATSGNITATNGNLVLTASGKTLDISTSTAASAAMGTATLVNGTKTVSTTAIATGNYIFLQLDTPGGTSGIHYSAPVGSITDGTSFVINAVDVTGAVVTTDTSTIRWIIYKNH